MVGGGAAGFEELDAAVGVDGGGGEHGGEVGEWDVLGAGAGDEGAAGGEHAQRAEVHLFVTAHGGLEGAFGFGKGGRVEDDGVELFLGGIEIAEKVERVGFDPVDLRGDLVCVAFEIGVGYFEGGAAGVYAGDAGGDAGQVEGEASLVGANVQSAGVGDGGSVGGGRGVVEALVEEGSGFLAGGGVVGEGEAVEGEGGGELRVFGVRGVERGFGGGV